MLHVGSLRCFCNGTWIKVEGFCFSTRVVASMARLATALLSGLWGCRKKSLDLVWVALSLSLSRDRGAGKRPSRLPARERAPAGQGRCLTPLGVLLPEGSAGQARKDWSSSERTKADACAIQSTVSPHVRVASESPTSRGRRRKNVHSPSYCEGVDFV